MANLRRRIEKLEETALLAQGDPLTLILLDAGAEISAEGQKRIDEAKAEAKAAGRVCVLVNLLGEPSMGTCHGAPLQQNPPDAPR